ncbi:hypothetical protein LIER_12921 [Lithospermum erythrorhizon]|uniref:Uncharacterized protein n=1 Tax=Lithospermum erythrorhizon TaxID=34254 RepID=A0AAV3PVK9_LITER
MPCEICKLEITHEEKGTFKVNGERLKNYYGGHVERVNRVVMLCAPLIE